MTGNQGDQLSCLISTANGIIDETRTSFGNLTVTQLKWKPAADQWSVAQCLDHLLTTNAAYFPIFERVLSGVQTNTFWERLPVLPGLWGKLLIRSLDPKTTRKLKAPKIFSPSSSNIDDTVVRRFLDQQNQVISYMTATMDLDLEEIIISSPVTNKITYSLMDAFRIIVVHERRHLLQATRVSQMDGFPMDGDSVERSSMVAG